MIPHDELWQGEQVSIGTKGLITVDVSDQSLWIDMLCTVQRKIRSLDSCVLNCLSTYHRL